MNEALQADFRAGLRRLLSEQGQVVQVKDEDRERYPSSPERWVSPYGWEDFDATYHVKTPTEQERAQWPDVEKYYHSCSLVVPEGSILEEVSYSEFAGTGHEYDESVGINVYGGPEGAPTEVRCSCGKYRGLTVRWQGSLTDALTFLFSIDARVTYTL